jgi:hypothetical protein
MLRKLLNNVRFHPCREALGGVFYSPYYTHESGTLAVGHRGP